MRSTFCVLWLCALVLVFCSIDATADTCFSQDGLNVIYKANCASDEVLLSVSKPEYKMVFEDRSIPTNFAKSITLMFGNVILDGGQISKYPNQIAQFYRGTGYTFPVTMNVSATAVKYQGAGSVTNTSSGNIDFVSSNSGYSSKLKITLKDGNIPGFVISIKGATIISGDDESSRFNLGLIIGIAAGGTLALLLVVGGIIGLVCYLKKRKPKTQEQKEEEQAQAAFQADAKARRDVQTSKIGKFLVDGSRDKSAYVQEWVAQFDKYLQKRNVSRHDLSVYPMESLKRDKKFCVAFPQPLLDKFLSVRASQKENFADDWMHHDLDTNVNERLQHLVRTGGGGRAHCWLYFHPHELPRIIIRIGQILPRIEADKNPGFKNDEVARLIESLKNVDQVARNLLEKFSGPAEERHAELPWLFQNFTWLSHLHWQEITNACKLEPLTRDQMERITVAIDFYRPGFSQNVQQMASKYDDLSPAREIDDLKQHAYYFLWKNYHENLDNSQQSTTVT